MRLFSIGVRDVRERGQEPRGVATLWCLQPDGSVRPLERPLDLYYDEARPGPIAARHFVGGEPVRLRRTRVRSKAGWTEAQRARRDHPDPRALPEVSWLGLKADEAFLIQQGLRFGDYLRTDGTPDPARADDSNICPDLPILAFDLETTTLRTDDPHARIITIGAVFRQGGRTERYLYQLGEVDPSPGLEGVNVRTFGSMPRRWDLGPRDAAGLEAALSALDSVSLDAAEADMLEAFEELVDRLDPRILAGHNIDGFDVHWLVRRSQALLRREGRDGPEPRCPRWSVGRREVFYYEVERGKKSRRSTTLEGRAYFDTLTWSRAQLSKERSYKLNALGAKYCGETKHDLHWREIVPAWLRGPGPDGRGRLAAYCVQDVDLTLRYADARSALLATYAMARHTHLTFDRFMGQSTQAFIFATFNHACLEAGVFLPWSLYEIFPKSGKYEGGHVFEIEPGYYAFDALEPANRGGVITVDFASLYPRAEISRNMCTTTLVATNTGKVLGKRKRDGAADGWAEDQLWTCPVGHTYLRAEVRAGITPAVLTKYLELRTQFKRRMKAAGTPEERASWDAAQLAAKVICNATYGAFGTAVSNGAKLPCLPIAESTTAEGRANILRTDALVAEHFGPVGVRRIAGDTDSVILFVHIATARAHPDVWLDRVAQGPWSEAEWNDRILVAVGRAIVDFLNPHYAAPMYIELDDIFRNYLLRKKKNYAGSYWQPGPDGGLVPMGRAPGDLKIQGVECKRMNWEPLVAEVQFHALRALFGLSHHPTPILTVPAGLLTSADNRERATAILRWAAGMIARNAAPFEAYRLEMELTKPIDEYGNSPPVHVKAAIRLRDAGEDVHVRDRIAFVMVQDLSAKRRDPSIRHVPTVPRTMLEVDACKDPVARRYYYDRFDNMVRRTFTHVLGRSAVEELLCNGRVGWMENRVDPSGIWAAFRRL